MASEFTLLAVTDAASLELVSKLLLQSPQNLRAEILAGDKLQHLIADLRDGKHSALCITNSGDKLAEVADSLGIAKHLKQRDEDMRRIIDASADSVLICDADGTILFLNPAAKKAFKRCEIGDHFGYPVVDGETVEVDLFCDANKRRVAEMRVVAIKWNQTEACLATLRDVTERIQAEELLESKVRDRTKDLEAANAQLRHMYRIADQAVRLRSNFIANVSHEIRTPLAGIVSGAELLRDSASPEELETLPEVIYDSAKRLMELVTEILDFARVERGDVTIVETERFLVDFINEVILPFQTVADRKGLNLSIELEPSLEGHFTGDFGKIRQILTNLLSNALKFTDSGGVILSVLSREPGELCFSVQDTGMGISDKDAPLIFQPFVQANNTIQGKFGGTGLGLSICKQLAEALHGSLSFRSSPGIGSKFTLKLPLKAADANT